MLLRCFSIKNYRSIHDTPMLPFGRSLTLIGPNNEGKSNIVRAVVTALEILKWHSASYSGSFRLARMRAGTSRRSKEIYSWENDFPKGKQARRGGNSVFSLVFDLNEDDRAAFKKEINSKINNELPIEISIGRREPSFTVRKRGPGAQVLTDKSKEIARFIGRRIELNHIEAVRKAEDAQWVVDSVVSRALQRVEENDELKIALETVARLQRPVLDEIQGALLRSLKQFLPSVRRVEINPAQEIRARSLRTVDIMIDDGQPTALSQKGDGVISLTALALLTGIGIDDGLFSPSSSRVAGGNVLAIEEPESHLHPNAIHYIRQVIDNIAPDKQVLITTHSPLLVNRAKLTSNIIVENNAARVCQNIGEIRESLGVKVADNLVSARIVLLCEGSDDVKKLVPLLSEISPNVRSRILQGELAVQGIGGAAKLSYHANILQNSVCEVIALLDQDKAGKSSWEKANAENLLDSRDVFFTNVEGMVESELEDLLSHDVVKNFVSNNWAVDVDLIRRQHKGLKFSDRIGYAFMNQGKPFDNKILLEVKNKLATEAGRIGRKAFDENRINPIIALAKAIEARI